METIDLDIDEMNELAFKLRIDGAASGNVTARLCCEGSEGLMHAVIGHFNGEPETVTFKMPRMTGVVSEGTYPAWIEILIDNKQFVPATFNLQFKQPVRVQVESVVERTKSTPATPTVAVENVSVARKITEVKKPINQSSSDKKPNSLKAWYGQSSSK